MANVTNTNAAVAAGQFIGREFSYFTVSKTSHSAANRLAIIKTLETFGTVDIVGDLGTANSFRVAMSGVGASTSDISTAVGAAVSGATVADFTF
jgi:hypothetical protein